MERLFGIGMTLGQLSAQSVFVVERINKMKISKEKICLIEDAIMYCDEEDKSTEFMIQYIQDYAGVDFDTVIDYLNPNNKIKGC